MAESENIYEQYAEATKGNIEIQNSYKYLFQWNNQNLYLSCFQSNKMMGYLKKRVE